MHHKRLRKLLQSKEQQARQLKSNALSAEIKAVASIMVSILAKGVSHSSSEVFGEISRIPVVVRELARLISTIETSVSFVDSRNV